MRRLIVPTFFLSIIIFTFGCGTSTTTSTTTTTLPGCYIGAFVDGLANTPSFESSIGKNLAVNMFYIDWPTSFPSTECDSIKSYGGVPMITWQPALNIANTLESISSGTYDAYIASFAASAKNWGSLIYLRFGHEMNGNWYGWDGYHNGSSLGPAKYIAAWKHIYAIFSQAGATNVKFIWSPNHKSYPDESWNEAIDYYPGSDYVDWIALDGYNWGGNAWQTFDEIFSVSYTTFEAYGKNIMLGEFSCAEDGGSKAAWITDAFTKIRTNYPKIKLFNWFNINKERDWRINSSAATLSAFISALGNIHFSGEKPAQ